MNPPINSSSRDRGNRLVTAVKDNLLLLLGLVALAWGLEGIDFVFRGFLDRFGIQPRAIASLPGILFAPFLHLGFTHLISNTVPFLILGSLVLVGGRKAFLSASLFIIVVGGAALWLFGPSHTNHIGASGLIFGYLGFLLTRGIVGKSGFWIVVSIGIILLYGGMLRGVLPGQPGISWQGHLFGFVAGMLAAWMMFSRGKTQRAGTGSRQNPSPY
ncbi:rhomboid family intramembrane serine protease [Verrucomicrobiaceae bacterium 5K15]|uniref:Rhomboid family intramembrane serine protease n=1 Tax=Oceaniferula flava TaxID=2800421 RepID=A0AAE2SB71_9BACT|nr:rhomboid family intramembrane serine protease [Oceaniferula flavus]MBK1854915.1 rhomboid family intramembrane serine protease [Oceaniferula flavus]MBM1136221.1 rhomboid family intramembrane serine protease [Oceaniferula flavus]